MMRKMEEIVIMGGFMIVCYVLIRRGKMLVRGTQVRGKRKPYPAFVPDDPGMCHHLLLYLLPPMFFLHSVSTAAWFW